MPHLLSAICHLRKRSYRKVIPSFCTLTDIVFVARQSLLLFMEMGDRGVRNNEKGEKADVIAMEGLRLTVRKHESD